MRIIQTLCIPAVGVLLSGCFAMQPVGRVQPAIGSEVALDLTDAGRDALAPALGREVGQVHGHLLERDSTDYVLAVTSVEFLHGGSQVLTGQQVHVPARYTSQYYENRVSVQRTIVLSGVVVAGAVLTARQILNVSPSSGDTPAPPPDEKQRSPRRVGVSVRSTDAVRLIHKLVPLIKAR